VPEIIKGEGTFGALPDQKTGPRYNNERIMGAGDGEEGIVCRIIRFRVPPIAQGQAKQQNDKL